MSDVIDVPADIEPAPIEIDPPICEQCGFAIEDLEELIYLRAADLVAQWKRADPRDGWRHTGEHPPRVIEQPCSEPEPYRPAQSTVAAFKYVLSLDDPDYLARWLARHPLDASALCKLWEGKNAA